MPSGRGAQHTRARLRVTAEQVRDVVQHKPTRAACRARNTRVGCVCVCVKRMIVPPKLMDTSATHELWEEGPTRAATACHARARQGCVPTQTNLRSDSCAQHESWVCEMYDCTTQANGYNHHTCPLEGWADTRATACHARARQGCGITQTNSRDDSCAQLESWVCVCVCVKCMIAPHTHTR